MDIREDSKSLQERKRERKKKRRIAYAIRIGICVGLLLAIVLILTGMIALGKAIFTKGSGKPGGKQQGTDSVAVVKNQDLREYAEIENQAVKQEAKVIILDAGHGGDDGGTVVKSVAEKDLNLEIVLKLQALLEKKGVKVILTREDDSTVELSQRTDLENQTEADLFVSIHCNSYEKDKSVRGLEVYYYPTSDEGKYYAQTLCDILKERSKILVRGDKENNYYVLKNTVCPAILVEVGYLTNASDRANLTDSDYQDKLSQRLADGILEMLNKN